MDTSQAQRQCPFCAEEIRADALKCRYCGSYLFSAARERFREASARAHERGEDMRVSAQGRLLLGVCAKLGAALSLPPVLLRFAFVMLGIVLHGGAIFAYLALWAFLPGNDGGASPLERGLIKLRGIVEGVRAIFSQRGAEPRHSGMNGHSRFDNRAAVRRA